MEKIITICETDEVQSGGIKIVTTEQVIEMSIDTSTRCCEDAGYILSEDNFNDFIGADLLGISLTDTALNSIDDFDVNCGGIMFVNINTSKGLLQFAAYNIQNGNYGHDVIIKSNQLTHYDTL